MYKHLTYEDRVKMEVLFNKKYSAEEIADYLKVHVATVYREFGRGRYMHTLTDLTEEPRYSADKAQALHDWLATNKGRPLKIGSDMVLARFIEKEIADDRKSPEVVAEDIKDNWHFSIKLSPRTIRRYIASGMFLRLTQADLPNKGKYKVKKNKIRVIKAPKFGKSIDLRPDILNRHEFGHWEMDTVRGKLGVTRSCLLVLTERKTLKERIFKLKDGRAKTVVRALNKLERELGTENFKKIFKTITVDNGVEFSDSNGIERSINGGYRTVVYYCHPYCSWERGSNENQNKLIRRHLPKGTDLDQITDKQVRYIEEWMNTYRRRKFGYNTADQLYKFEVLKLGA